MLNSVAGTTLQITGPAVCLLYAQSSTISSKPARSMLLATIAFGVFLTAVVFIETVYSVGWLTDYTSGSFWCDVVG